MSISAYKSTQRASESPRDIERQIFSRVTAALATHGPACDMATGTEARLAALNGTLQLALSENIRLWSLLRMDLSQPDNQLPEELRAQLISLSLYVERQTSGILRGTAFVSELVAVNRSIISGLAGISPEPSDG